MVSFRPFGSVRRPSARRQTAAVAIARRGSWCRSGGVARELHFDELKGKFDQIKHRPKRPEPPQLLGDGVHRNHVVQPLDHHDDRVPREHRLDAWVHLLGEQRRAAEQQAAQVDGVTARGQLAVRPTDTIRVCSVKKHSNNGQFFRRPDPSDDRVGDGRPQQSPGRAAGAGLPSSASSVSMDSDEV